GGGSADGALSAGGGPPATWGGPARDRPPPAAGRGAVVPAEQRGADGLPPVSPRRSADDEQLGGVAGGGVQRAGQGEAEVLESPRGGGGDAASAGGAVERGWEAGALLRRTPWQSRPPSRGLIGQINRRTVHDLSGRGELPPTMKPRHPRLSSLRTQRGRRAAGELELAPRNRSMILDAHAPPAPRDADHERDWHAGRRRRRPDA